MQPGVLKLQLRLRLRASLALPVADIQHFRQLVQGSTGFLRQGGHDLHHVLLTVQLGFQLLNGLLGTLLDPVVIRALLGKCGHFGKADGSLLLVDLDGEGLLSIRLVRFLRGVDFPAGIFSGSLVRFFRSLIGHGGFLFRVSPLLGLCAGFLIGRGLVAVPVKSRHKVLVAAVHRFFHCVFSFRFRLW